MNWTDEVFNVKKLITQGLTQPEIAAKYKTSVTRMISEFNYEGLSFNRLKMEAKHQRREFKAAELIILQQNMKMNNSKLAEYLDVNVATIKRWRNGTSEVPSIYLKYLKLVTNSCGMSQDHL